MGDGLEGPILFLPTDHQPPPQQGAGGGQGIGLSVRDASDLMGVSGSWVQRLVGAQTSRAMPPFIEKGGGDA